MTWDCYGGVTTSLTDENGQVSDLFYTGNNSLGTADPNYWRPYGTEDQLNNGTSFTYPSITISQSSMLFNGGNSVVAHRTKLDSFGRLIVQQTKQGPSSSNYDSVETDYGNMGRVSKRTMPYSATADTLCSGTCPGTTQSYDPIGRPLVTTDGGSGTITLNYPNNNSLPGYPNDVVFQTVGPAPAGENTKRKQFEYDGLGRLISVCEVSAASGSGTCGQSVTRTGFWTKYTYDVLDNIVSVTQNAQAAVGSRQTRTFSYDMLGRLTSETNPESGTTNYTYDSVSSGNCAATSPSDLMLKTDANGNGTCYTYDALHRLLSVGQSNNGSPNASVTPDKCFVYDSAIVSGVTMSYAKTHLAEAYTVAQAAGCGATKLTDEGFSYSPRGEIADVWQKTPNSGGYYHVSATYWPNGVQNTLSAYLANGTAFIPTETYGVDAEGRWKTVTASSAPNPVTNTTYNTASQITGITFGSSDSDSFTYDSNTGRMTQYKYTLNGSSEIGNLTWNANGTLKTLAITDPFNSSNAQTCNYSYDDLVRTTSANCGTAWSQTFGFDPFGNLTKTGSVSWQPGYNTATNRYTLAGTSYDANGNVLNDTFRTYTWDADGRPVTIGNKTMTYDALDRMVEKLDGGVYNQFVYSPQGGLLARMNVQSGVSVRVLLPNAWAVYGSSSSFNHYEHLDWLGNSRLSSNQSRAMTSDIAYAPFGEAYASTATSGVSFTGMRSDVQGVSGGVTSGLYDFLARELPPTQGRWLSPDPAGLAAVAPAMPQSWNRYAYVTNNPLSLVDPLGLVPPCTNDPNDGIPCIQVTATGTMPGCVASGTEGCIPFPCTLLGTCGGAPGPVTIGGGPSGGQSSGGGGGNGTSSGSASSAADNNSGHNNYGCISPNFAQHAAIKLLSKVAAFTGRTVGYGIGGSIGAGKGKFGFNVSGSQQLLVAPDGSAGLVTTYTKQVFGVASTGTAGVVGIQLSSSTAQTIGDLQGYSLDMGASAADGLGMGGDANISPTSNGADLGVTVTFGAGFGGYSHGGQVLQTIVSPFCGD